MDYPTTVPGMLRSLRVAVLAALIAASLGGRAAANEDDGVGPDENTDRATPGSAPVDSRPVRGETMVAARAVSGAIDDFRYDELVLEGRAAEVCAGRLLTGSSWTFFEITDRFGGSSGTMYSCRERWDAANDPDCNGTVVNPATNPNFESTCWSNHARGRAIDIMVGRSGGTYNRARGVAIVNWLLATDGLGSVNANARKLGIQQILFADRCWNADGDRGIGTWSSMRECGIGHHDHVHIDLTVAGANGQVSYWGATPEISAKFDTQVWWIWRTPYRQAISWWNLRATDEGRVTLPAAYDRGYRGDFDGDGLTDETMLWDDETGNWVVQNWNDGNSLNARLGTWSRNFDEIVVGDFDADGRVDDTLAWDRDSGGYGVQSWSNYAPTGRRSGTIPRQFDEIIVADLDGNGVLNDTLLRDRDTGNWAVWSWWIAVPTQRSTGHWGASWELTIPGDWSAGGEQDETLIVDVQSGRYLVLSWSGWRPRTAASGAFDRSTYDFGVPGDYDTDGRIDDVFMYDTASGQWAIYSFHRNVGRRRLGQDWGSYEQIVSGQFME